MRIKSILALALIAASPFAFADNSNYGAPASSSSGGDQAKNHMDLAVSYFSNGQLDIAFEEARKVLAVDSRNSSALTLQAMVLSKRKDYQPAEELYKQALGSDPKNADARNNYGIMLCEQKKKDAAMEQFGRALATPGYQLVSSTLVNAGICLLKLEDYPVSEQYLLKALEEDPGAQAANYQLAKLYFLTGKLDKSELRLAQLHRSVAPSSASVFLQILLLQKKGNVQQSQDLVQQLLTQFPKSFEAGKALNGDFKL